MASYLWSGRDVSDFGKWLELFRGSFRPIDDLVDYLHEEHGFVLLNLLDELARAPQELRVESQEFWHEVHGKRRGGTEVDPGALGKLVAHDVENFLGVIQRRAERETGSPLGYSSWWLTFDTKAYSAASELAKRCDLKGLDSPVMSIDFLSYYLAVGPARRQLARRNERELPLIMDTSLLDAPPQDLIEAASAVREEMKGQEERVIRRKVRDHLEQEKLRQGDIGRTGIEAIEYDIRYALESAGRRR